MHFSDNFLSFLPENRLNVFVCRSEIFFQTRVLMSKVGNAFTNSCKVLKCTRKCCKPLRMSKIYY